MVEFVEQAIPSETHCPSCGEKPTEESLRMHSLQAMGYFADDVKFKCRAENCGHEWVCGVPIGRPSDGFGDDLLCNSCNTRWMYVHFCKTYPESPEVVDYQLKCPNRNCFYFKTIRRTATKDHNGYISMLGYPEITGETVGAEEYGRKLD